MKKQHDINTTVRTIIEDISSIGNELSDEHLRLVAGGAKPRKCWVRSSSYSVPGKPDRAQDWKND
jgi:hypothetical protein